MIETYKNMEELKVDIERMKSFFPVEIYESILFVCGILENQGISEEIEIQGKQIKIDKHIVPIIEELNQIGCKTLACCSGLQEEHSNAKFPPKVGYLCIEYNEELYKSLFSKVQGSSIKVETSECYFQPCIRMVISGENDTALKDNWSSLTNIMRKIKKS